MARTRKRTGFMNVTKRFEKKKKKRLISKKSELATKNIWRICCVLNRREQRIFRILAEDIKKKKILTISSQYQRNKLGKMYMKNDFSIVIFSDECRATLDLMLRCYREIVFQYKRKKWGHSVMF